jgi:hypothetical protein
MGSGIKKPTEQKQAKRIVNGEAFAASLESAKVSVLEKLSVVHKRVTISIETSSKLEALTSEYMRSEYMMYSLLTASSLLLVSILIGTKLCTSDNFSRALTFVDSKLVTEASFLSIQV